MFLRHHKDEQGFALPAAIFLVVILALLISASLTLTMKSAQVSASDTAAITAYQVARAGVQYGINRSSASGACWSGTLDLSSLSGTSGFRAVISCSSTSANESGSTLTFYTITSTACNASTCPVATGSEGRDYVERSITSTVVRCTAGVC